MRIQLSRHGPPDLAARLRSCRSLESGATKQVDEEVKAAGGRAADLVQGDRSQTFGAIPRLFEELASRGVLEALVPLDVPAREKPCTGERTGGLFDYQDPTDVIDARDDRADPRPFGHER